MKVLAFFEHVVAVLIMSAIALALFLAFCNGIAPMSKANQTRQMEPTLEMYRAFHLRPVVARGE